MEPRKHLLRLQQQGWWSVLQDGSLMFFVFSFRSVRIILKLPSIKVKEETMRLLGVFNLPSRPPPAYTCSNCVCYRKAACSGPLRSDRGWPFSCLSSPWQWRYSPGNGGTDSQSQRPNDSTQETKAAHKRSLVGDRNVYFFIAELLSVSAAVRCRYVCLAVCLSWCILMLFSVHL